VRISTNTTRQRPHQIRHRIGWRTVQPRVGLLPGRGRAADHPRYEAGNEIITQFHYDTARLLYQVDSRVIGGAPYTADQWTRYTFDAAGNVIGEELWSRDTGNARLVIQRVFDAYNRIDTITRGGVTEDLDYNPDGTLAARTDGNLNTTRYSYDAFQRLTSTEQIGRVKTTMTYDTHGHPLSVTDPESHTTRYGYDDLGNRVRQESPDSGLTRYVFDEAGQLVAQTDARGQNSYLSYDAAGRLTTIDREGPDYDVHYVYDGCGNGLGRLCELTTGWGHSIHYAWNELGELRSVTTNEGRIGYTFGPRGALTSIEYPSGRIVRFGLDGGGLVSEIRLQVAGLPESVLLDGIGYSPTGRPVSWRFANGLDTNVQLDGRQRPLQIDVPGVFAWTAAGYDNGDNLLGLTAATVESTYLYDALDRLTGAESAGLSLGFTYDDVGNRLSQLTGGIVEAGTYEPGSNRLVGFGARQYSVDANGNTTAVSAGQAPLLDFRYSPHNRLSDDRQAAPAILASYRYDALGQRVESQRRWNRKVPVRTERRAAAVTTAREDTARFVYLAGQPSRTCSRWPMRRLRVPVETIIDDGQSSVFGASGSPGQGRGQRQLPAESQARRPRVYWYIDQTGRAGLMTFSSLGQSGGRWQQHQYTVRVINQQQTAYDTADVVVNHADLQEGDGAPRQFDIKPRHGSLRQMVELTGF
jgi:YD repeat-containing protein